MSTTLDATRRRMPSAPGRRGWWLVPECVALAVLMIISVPYLGRGSGQSGVHGEVAQLASRVLEQSSPDEHQNHGHAVTAEDRVLCGIDVFGTSPPTAAAAQDVDIVYGYYFCAIGHPGLTYLDTSRSDGPIVVHLKGTPAVTIAQHGAGYPERVRAMMPDEFEQYCFNGLPDGTVAEGVMRRYKDEVQA